MKIYFLPLIFAALLTAPRVAVSEESLPNVVLFLVDDMGWMDSEPYGSEYYETPNMNRLAKLSMRFTDAYAMPLCSPTRATILSGQYPARHGVTTASGHQPPQEEGASFYPEKVSPTKRYIYAESKNYLDPDILTIAEVLRETGYDTGHFGKWHLGAMQPHWPDKQGFDEIWIATPDPGPPSYFSPYGVSSEGIPTSKSRVGNITDGPDGEYITDRLTDEAIAFIQKNRESPFFLNLWQYGVHGPWGHKEEYTREFAKKKDPRGEQRNPIMASMLKSVDDSLGRILDTLDAEGLTGNTLFIFFSDNGGNVHSNKLGDRKLEKVKPGHPKYDSLQDWRKWAGGEVPTNNAPLREGKASIYEGGQRVPLMVRWPGRIEEGSLTAEVVHAVDLYPTILDAAGVTSDVEQALDGVSLLPLLQEKASLDREAVFAWFPFSNGGVSVRKGNFKLIKRWEARPGFPNLVELYDLKSDLGEVNDLATEMPGKVEELSRLIDQFVEETGALVPKLNPDFREDAAQLERVPDFGLIPKHSASEVKNGVLTVKPTGRVPFLGTAQVKLKGPLKLEMKVRRASGGAGRIQWRSSGQETFPEEGQVVDYTLSGGAEWEIVTVELPVRGTSATIRLYLPEGDEIVEFDAIEFTDSNKVVKAWDFEAK
ncbi:MAG: sulfatase [Verrucomicrobiales bacterium]|nr:sulfatase [Verrucomicrobiales bacterium]